MWRTGLGRDYEPDVRLRYDDGDNDSDDDNDTESRHGMVELYTGVCVCEQHLIPSCILDHGSRCCGQTVRVCAMCDETNYRSKDFICFRLPTPW